MTTTSPFALIRASLRCRHGITSTQRCVLLVYADAVNDKRGDRISWPSIDSIGNALDLKRRTVKDAIDALIELGHLESVGPTRGGRGMSTRYRVNNCDMADAVNVAAGRTVSGGGNDAAGRTVSRREKDAVRRQKQCGTPPKTVRHTAPEVLKELRRNDEESRARDRRPKSATGARALLFSPDFINADLQQRVMERKHWTPDQCDAFIAKFASKHDCVVHPLVRWLALFESWANGERLPDQANGVSNWWTTEAATIAKGRTLGVEARAGEAMAEFKGRIFAAIAQARSLSKSEQRARTATSVFESAIPAPQAERDITAECERLDD